MQSAIKSGRDTVRVSVRERVLYLYIYKNVHTCMMFNFNMQ